MVFQDKSSILLKRTEKWKNVFDITVQPIESINIKHNVKCFTFFSHLSQPWKDIRIDFLKFQIFISQKFNWIPPHMIERYYLALHSPKSIPIFEYGTNFIEVKPNKINLVTFKKMNVDVKNAIICQDYDDSKYLSSDCIAICMLRNIQNKYGRFYAMNNLFLLTKSHYIQPDSTDFTSEFKPECIQSDQKLIFCVRT